MELRIVLANLNQLAVAAAVNLISNNKKLTI